MDTKASWSQLAWEFLTDSLATFCVIRTETAVRQQQKNQLKETTDSIMMRFLGFVRCISVSLQHADGDLGVMNGSLGFPHDVSNSVTLDRERWRATPLPKGGLVRGHHRPKHGSSTIDLPGAFVENGPGMSRCISYWKKNGIQLLLLMEEILNNHLGCIKPCK